MRGYRPGVVAYKNIETIKIIFLLAKVKNSSEKLLNLIVNPRRKWVQVY